MLNPCDAIAMSFKARPIASLIVNDTARLMLADILLALVAALEIAVAKVRLGPIVLLTAH